LNLADPQDVCYDYSDLVPPTVTVFSRILREKESMQVWNEFIEKEEKEQRRILKEIDTLTIQQNTTANKVKGVTHQSPEKRDLHPAYSAQACFDRLDKKFKSTLKKMRGLPLDLIVDIERRLREFFDASADGIWIDIVPSGTERYYLHCIAQYLMLISTSIHDEHGGGGTVVEIRNRRSLFIPPHKLLAEYLLERKAQRKNQL
jgi:hypothetical protein